MDRIKFSKLKGYNVQTKSGTFIGVLHDIEMDKNSLRCLNILVSPAGIVKKIISAELIISIDDIIEIFEDKIIVLDSVIKEKGSKLIIEELSGKPSAQALNSQN